ncbi:hypothetical protein SFA35_15200 [Pseudomonas sp. HR96]|uniref:hypothetical protein n=1 Tax=Pseudomonas sp. HR96 TaxID=1027966 RepID=UPI002A748E1D|nr:hypothetical protein [Pseudomonas sp. HR96]WPO97996.1 hypothetical protein SFA35_15200 [Pseudomonas sp. HR96]
MNDQTSNGKIDMDEVCRRALESDLRYLQELDERASRKPTWAERIGLWEMGLPAVIILTLYGMLFYFQGK